MFLVTVEESHPHNTSVNNAAGSAQPHTSFLVLKYDFNSKDGTRKSWLRILYEQCINEPMLEINVKYIEKCKNRCRAAWNVMK